MYILVLILPFYSFLFSFFFGSYIGIRMAYLNTFIIFLVALICGAIWPEVVLSHFTSHINLFSLFDTYFFEFGFSLWFDSLSVTMLNIVVLISLMVHIFSLKYLQNDPNFVRFFLKIHKKYFGIPFLLIRIDFHLIVCRLLSNFLE